MTANFKVFLIVASFIVLTPLYAANSQEPKLEFLTKDLDVGEVQKNQLLDIKVKVRNAGTKDLVIENVYSSCGCFEVTDPRWQSSRPALRPRSNNIGIAERAPASSAQYSSSEGSEGVRVEKKPEPVIVKPGKSIFIATRLDTNKVTGQFEKQLHIISNDPAVKDAVWKIKGVVLDSGLTSSMPSPRSNNIRAPEYSSSEGSVGARVEKPMSEAKVVMLFYTPGCGECNEIREKFLPGIKDKYREKILIVEYNIDNPESFAFMIDLQNKYDQRAKKGFFNPKPPTVFIEKTFLYGVKEIEKDLDFYIGKQ